MSSDAGQPGKAKNRFERAMQRLGHLVTVKTVLYDWGAPVVISAVLGVWAFFSGLAAPLAVISGIVLLAVIQGYLAISRLERNVPQSPAVRSNRFLELREQLHFFADEAPSTKSEALAWRETVATFLRVTIGDSQATDFLEATKELEGKGGSAAVKLAVRKGKAVLRGFAQFFNLPDGHNPPSQPIRTQRDAFNAAMVLIARQREQGFQLLNQLERSDPDGIEKMRFSLTTWMGATWHHLHVANPAWAEFFSGSDKYEQEMTPEDLLQLVRRLLDRLSQLYLEYLWQ